jgi:ATP-binding cassette, subfamily F, member 3
MTTTKISHLQKYIDRFKAKATKAKQAQKRREAELRQQTAPLRKQISQLEEKMSKHSSKLAEIENQLADSELYSAENKEKLTALLAQQVEMKKALEEVEMDWLAAQEELEAMLQA